ncbi:MAG: hypothetical protein U1E11_03970, partial [Dethiobacteria bacterium]|nr:hypothetical protein [Dethiobacteria bacterium]
MNVNNNIAKPNQAYMRELYNTQNAVRREQLPETPQNNIVQLNKSDSLFISAETKRMRQVEQALNVNGNILDQQGAIYRPGLEETVLRSDLNTQPDHTERPEAEQRNVSANNTAPKPEADFGQHSLQHNSRSIEAQQPVRNETADPVSNERESSRVVEKGNENRQ